MLSYFVDEAGDTTLFGRHGTVLVGTEALSRFFIVGRLEVDDVAALEADTSPCAPSCWPTLCCKPCLP